MSPLERDLSKWLRPIVGDKMFPVLALQVKNKVASENRFNPNDSTHMFGYKTGVVRAADEIFNVIIQLSEQQESERELFTEEEYGDLDSPLNV